MATKYIRAAGGAWGDAATWALTSGGTEVTTVPTAADDVVTDSNSGASTVNAAIGVKSFVQTGNPGIVTNNGFPINSSGNVTLLSGKYIASNTAARINIVVAGTLTTGGNAMGVVGLSAATVLGDNMTFIADKLCGLVLNGNFLDVNGKTISGNSAINRLLIYSNVIGTPRTITVNGGTFSNCDFQDISFANGGNNLDLSAITGGSGNCGGNSMSGGGTLTFTAPSMQTFATTSGSWSDSAKWTSRVPLPQDLARFQPMSAGQTITVDMPRLPDTDFSGCGSTNMPSVYLNVAGLTYSAYGSWNNTGIGTLWCNKNFSFMGRSNASLTSNGKAFGGSGVGRVYINTDTATVTFNDAFTTAEGLTHLTGNLSTNYNVTSQLFQAQGSRGTIAFGSGMWTLTGTSPMSMYGADVIVDAGTSTIALTSTFTSTFSAGGKTFYDITIVPGAGVLTLGSFNFHDMTMSSAGTRSIVFTKATTYTQTGTSFLSGTANNLITIASNTAGEPFTLSKASGLIASNYLAIKDSIATGGAVWLAGYNSTNISGNTGWHFNSPASGAGVIEFVGSATAKALCRGIPAAAEIVFTATATAKALCRAAGSGVIEFVGTCSAIVAAWKTTGLFKATERYIGQYFKASKRR